ncbi:MAG: sugar porter family MFS transporter [Bacteroidales bacterium]|nr:sugar porter family MFS transporter [Bacteroidales bacterium]
MNTDKIANNQSGNINHIRILALTVVAATGGFLFGFDSGVINGTVHALQEAFNSDVVGTGFNIASMLLGCAVGAFFAGNMADKIGRKKTLLIAAIFFIISAWGSGIASSSTEFVIYRILGGLAVGAASIISPAYIGEIAPPHIRGRLISLQQLAIVLGLFMAFFSNYNIALGAGGAAETFWWGYKAWQWMFWIEVLPASLFFLFLFLIPESPRYLVAIGKHEKARNILAKLTEIKTANLQVESIRKTVIGERKSQLSDIINPGSGKIYTIVWVGMALAALQQFTGINVVFYYGSVLWQAAGFTEADALLTNVISGSVNVLFTFVAIALVDRVGRKPLLLIGALGQALMLGILALIFAYGSKDSAAGLELTGKTGIMALLAANAYIAFFAFTWGPVMWVMLGEMFPNKFRGAALAVAGLVQWGSNFLITISFPILLTSIGLGMSYGIYAAFGLIAFWVVKKHVTETKGRTLEQISMDHAG